MYSGPYLKIIFQFFKSENIRKIEESTSPYFNIKRSAVGLGILGKFKEKPPTDNPGTSNSGSLVKRSMTDLSDKVNIKRELCKV